MSALVLLLLLLLGLGGMDVAVVQAQGVVLRWQAAPGCPSRAAFAGRLAEYLGDASAHEAQVAVTLALRGDGTLTARVEVAHEGRSGIRVLQDQDCAALADAAAFAAAVIIDPAITPAPEPRPPLPVEVAGDVKGDASNASNAGRADSVGSEGASPSGAEGAGAAAAGAVTRDVEGDAGGDRDAAPPPTATSADTPPAAATHRRGAQALLLRPEAVAAIGVLPGLAPGVGLAIGYGLSGRLRVELLGRFLPERDAQDAAVSGAAGKLALLELGFRSCATYSDANPVLPLCVGVRAGSMPGRGGEALLARRDESLPWLALEVAVALRWRLTGWLALHAELAALVPLVRPEFRVEGLGTLHQSAAVGLAGSAGPEVRLW